MFFTQNHKARKFFVGRRLQKGTDGVNIFYSVPIKKSEKKRSLLTLVRHTGEEKIRIDLTGNEVRQLRRILYKGIQLMK